MMCLICEIPPVEVTTATVALDVAVFPVPFTAVAV